MVCLPVRVWTAVRDLPVDPLPLFAASATRERTLLAWEGGWMLAEGVAAESEADGPGRCAWLIRFQAAIEAVSGPDVRLLLALASEERCPGPSHWGAALPSARLWLPRRLRWRGPDGTGYEQCAEGSGLAGASAQAPDWPLPAGDFTGRVEDAVALIADGVLRKLVLARAVDQDLRGGDETAILARLRAQDPDATLYAHDLPGGALFCGATPEMLCAAEGEELGCAALAGSCPRGRDEAETLAQMAALMGSTKQRKEHGLVVEHLVAVLRERCHPFRVPSVPVPRRQRHLIHLETPVQARLLRRDYLELAGALHPTPATCGLPVATAAHWLRRHEGLHRGLYAGVLGWLSGAGCRLSVPLRGGILSPRRDRARLFAGAGIVETSDPQSELAETELKLTVMREALG